MLPIFAVELFFTINTKSNLQFQNNTIHKKQWYKQIIRKEKHNYLKSSRTTNTPPSILLSLPWKRSAFLSRRPHRRRVLPTRDNSASTLERRTHGIHGTDTSSRDSTCDCPTPLGFGFVSNKPYTWKLNNMTNIFHRIEISQFY